jgi:hypothetical protein
MPCDTMPFTMEETKENNRKRMENEKATHIENKASH